jgi:alpha-aminoadipate carrier protein LysW
MTKRKTGMNFAYCPDCGEEVNLGVHPKEGQSVTCPNCGADLEVISLEPLELDWAYDDLDEEWETSEEVWD